LSSIIQSIKVKKSISLSPEFFIEIRGINYE
jgi:hypothetical protein